MYIKIENDLPVGEAVSVLTIRLLYPNISVPTNPSDEVLDSLGYARYVNTPYPSIDEFQKVAQGEISKNQDGVYTRPYLVTDIEFDAALKILKARIAEKRWMVETSGLTVNGAPVDTSIEAQNRLSNAVLNGLRLGMSTVSFKASNGEFVTMSMEQLVPVVDAISYHVQACFAAEAAHVAEVDALETMAELRQYAVEGLHANWL